MYARFEKKISSTNFSLILVILYVLKNIFRPRRGRPADPPELVLGYMADLVEFGKNMKGLHMIFCSLVPDPETPEVDERFQKFDKSLKKLVEEAGDRFSFLHLA